MVNPGIAGFLAHEREQDLARRARNAARTQGPDGGRPLRGRNGRSRPLARLATWAGLVMVRAGQRLAGIEVLSARPPHLQRPA
jgi:hypothetical protein